MEQSNEMKRPAFLTVLCILTWVGSGLGLIGGIMSLGASSTVSDLGALSGDSAVGAVADSIATMNYVNLICVILCILGSVMMWQMKKTGFYIYVLGELAPLVMSFIIVGELASMAGPFAGMAAAGAFIGALFPIAFVVMYAVNLKHMK